MTPPDPRRLRVAASPGSRLERALASARSRAPSDDQLRALEAALFSGAAIATMSAGSRAASHAAWAAVTKPIVAVLMAGAVTGATVWVGLRSRPKQPDGAAVAVPAAPRPSEPEVAPLARVAPPVAVSHPRRAHAPVAHVERRAADPAAPGGDADEELRLIGGAQRLLPDEPRRALALTREHEQKFPHGLLEEEREFVAISALLEIGEDDAARARAGRFSAAHAGSPYEARVRALLGQSTEGADKTQRPTP